MAKRIFFSFGFLFFFNLRPKNPSMPKIPIPTAIGIIKLFEAGGFTDSLLLFSGAIGKTDVTSVGFVIVGLVIVVLGVTVPAGVGAGTEMGTDVGAGSELVFTGSIKGFSSGGTIT